MSVQVWQECIPVGCVPAAHWPYAGACFSWGGGVCFWGVSAPGGVSAALGGVCFWGGCLLPGGCLLLGGGVSASQGGVCFWGGCLLPGGVPASWGVSASWRGVSASWGVSAPGGCLLWGVSAPGGCGYPSMHWGRHTPTVNRITDACKNITLAQLRYGR